MAIDSDYNDEHEPGQYCIDCRYWEMSPYDDPCDACVEIYEEGGPLRALWEAPVDCNHCIHYKDSCDGEAYKPDCKEFCIVNI